MKLKMYTTSNIKFFLIMQIRRIKFVLATWDDVPQNGGRRNELGNKVYYGYKSRSVATLRFRQWRVKVALRLFALRLLSSCSRGGRCIPDEQFSNSATKPETTASSFRINPDVPDAPRRLRRVCAFSNGLN